MSKGFCSTVMQICMYSVESLFCNTKYRMSTNSVEQFAYAMVPEEFQLICQRKNAFTSPEHRTALQWLGIRYFKNT